MNKSPKLVAVAAASIVSGLAGTAVHASVTNAASSTIASIQSFAEFGSTNGDVIFTLTSNSLSSSCPLGFWIKGGDIGAKNVLTQILAAYHTGLPVTVAADTATFWTGNSASNACLVWSVQS